MTSVERLTSSIVHTFNTNISYNLSEREKEDQGYEKWHLSSLKDVGVDLTQYLVNQAGAPVSQEVQVVGTTNNGRPPISLEVQGVETSNHTRAPVSREVQFVKTNQPGTQL